MFKGLKKKFSNKNKEKDVKKGAKPAEVSKVEVTDEREKEAAAAGGTEPPLVTPVETEKSSDPFATPIAKFADTPRNNHEALLIEKMRLCQATFFWSDEIIDADKDAVNKRIKREHLLDLVEFIGQNKKQSFSDQVLQELINMVAANLFRALPPKSRNPLEVDDEDAFPMEPSWPHLQIVYEFFLRFIVSNNLEVRGLRKYITANFVIQLLQLFDSEDRRERDYLKTILHRIYAKFMPLRAFIRKAINHTFWALIEMNNHHNGVAELLEILGSIINGFALPLKPEHKNFLFKVLIPMHKISTVPSFHTQLSYCVTQFVDKDQALAKDVLLGFLKFWPRTDSPKELLYLQEFEELLELTPDNSFQEIVKPICERVQMCVGSSHFQVAERTLFFWQNEYIYRLLCTNRDTVLPIIYKVLYENSELHWNPMVHKLTSNVLAVFTGLDQTLVEKCHAEYQGNKKTRQSSLLSRTGSWKGLPGADVPHNPQDDLPPGERILVERDRW